MVKLCDHEKMLILRCILPPKKLNLLQKKLNLRPTPRMNNLEHPDKKLNSLGTILIPRENLKPLEKYQPSPPKKKTISLYKKNIIPCKSFDDHRKASTIMKKPQTLHLKILNLSKILNPFGKTFNSLEWRE